MLLKAISSLTVTKRIFALFIMLMVAALLVDPPSPVSAAANQKQHGATLFHERGCEHCHGFDGRGGELGPELSTVGKEMKKPDIEHRILHGGGGMPPFADALQPDEVTALVDFLHAKRKAPKPGKITPAH